MSIRSCAACVRHGLFAIALLAGGGAHAADFTPLGSLPDPNTFGSAAHAVTPDGRTIAGESVVSGPFGGIRQAVFWRNDVGPTTVSPVPGSNAFTAVSADGTAAIGNSRVEGSPPNNFAFYWSQFTGTSIPGHPSGYVNSTASAISADGGTMVGSLYRVDPFGTPIDSQAARASRAEGLFFGGLGYLPGGTSSRANAVSADGSVIVGASTSASSEEAFRWTAATGMVGLGFLPGATWSAANFISDDGQAIVGTVAFSNNPSRSGAAFRWTEAAGMTDLGVLPGALATIAQAMSRDGRFVVGQSGAEAFLWTEAGGITPLGHLPGDQESSAIAVSDDGAVVLGRSSINGNFEYFVWTQADGPRSLRDLLAASGVDVTGWGNLQAAALSNDGNTIVGQAVNPAGAVEGWAIRMQGNRAPAASIGFSPQFPAKRQPVSFWGTGSTDPDGDEIVNYRWDLGDGTTGVGPLVSHTYPDARNYTVTLVVSDGKVDSAPVSVVVAVFDQMPIANPGGPYSGPKKAAIRFDGTASSDGDGDPLTYAWDFGDGTTGTGPTPTHIYARSGFYTVTLVVNDGSINSTPARATVSVNNTPPTALLSGPASAFKLTAVTWSGSGSSDANGDPLTYSWNFGDGASATTTTPATTHSYAAVGSYRVTLTVNDGETSSSPVSADVAIQSRPPVANAGPDQSVERRSTTSLNGTASSDPDGAIVGVRWVQVAGPAVTLSGSTTLSPTFVAPQVSTLTKLTFELTVTDDDNVSSSDRVDVQVVRR